MGLPGNERADNVAKRASLHPRPDTLSLPFQDFYPSTARAIIASSQTRWDTTRSACNRLAQIKPTIEEWGFPTQQVYHREVVLARLRIDHPRLTHGHLMAALTLLAVRAATFSSL